MILIFLKYRNTAMLMAVLFFVSGNVCAQVLRDTLREFNLKIRKKELISRDSRIQHFTPGQKITSIDSLTLERYQMQSVSNLLTQQVPVFVKSYGFNGLATLNFRGSSAAQSQVYWNGIPIQNAALGIADISILPVSMVNRLSIVYGSSSALLGSGNVGGALLLESEAPVFDSARSTNVGLSAGAGSYGQYQLGLKTRMVSPKWYLSANVFGQTAQSAFSYTDDQGISKKNTNAALQGVTVLTQAAFRPDERDVISFSAWYQQYYREIPAAFFDPVSLKNQKDGSLRLLLNWSRGGKNREFYVKSAFLSDRMEYRDQAVLLNTENTGNQYYQEIGIRQKLGTHHQFMVFAPVHISWMDLSAGKKNQSRYALAAAYSFMGCKEKLNLALNARGEFINEKAVFLPGINVGYTLLPWLDIRANLQKTYRAPSLNELYYEPGGNSSLKPEQGWSADAGYKIGLKMGKRITLKHDLSVFDRQIDNWIIWFGGSIWTPHNISSVHSRGIETENLLVLPVRACQVHLGINTSYVLATTTSSYYPNDGSIDKQLPYTPRYTGQLNVGFTYESFYFNYNQGYTGYRFINMDQSPPYLEPYSIANVQVSYHVGLITRPLTVTAQVNNIYNTRYQVVAYRPMPGINWLLGLGYNLK